MLPSVCIGETTHDEVRALLLKRRHVVVSGLSNETAKAMVTAHLLRETRRSVLVTEDAAKAQDLLHWLSFFGLSAFPVTFGQEPSAEDVSSVVRLLLCDGIAVLDRATWDAELPSLQALHDHAQELRVGDAVDFTEFFSALIDRGYRHADDDVLTPGDYRRTGDTLRILPMGEDAPVEVRFSYDRVESIAGAHGTREHVTIFPLAWNETAALSLQCPSDRTIVTDEQEDFTAPDSCLHLAITSFPESTEGHVHLRYLSVLKFYTLTDFINDVRDKLSQHWSLVIVTKRADELREVLQEERISFVEAPERKPGAITIVESSRDALLPHSLQNPDLRCALITDREIFSLRKEARQRSVQRLALDFITSLQSGDFVVHMEHGIGKFEGMTTKTVDAVEREYLELTYAENDRLFVPVDQADKLSKYVTEEGVEPTLTRLGSQEWKKATRKVSEETERIAKELLAIYAKRARAKGYAFDEDTAEQQRFDAAFPYTETPGQLKAIEDIKRDMESPHPMDRLVCGDVGFGKTEVAMRAAFKAVQSGKQVALLSPITILADQHYRSLQKRMEGFSVRIEMLSRFRSPAEQREILARIQAGEIDIVVGTHRLLQDDVVFHNLGLVIIDEEQRFGVAQKEKLKELRASVDLLTLTATPIPRTLNLGLHKLRDITTITTPPPGRLPIITEVRKYADALLREAILKEIERGGQAYVLHNRVETIDAFAMKLRALIPQATFIVTHGQLKPEVLEERILAFKNGQVSVLVSSTIIENGIDLPRANTLIVNEAERFGLSQLYQLRGRVGRGTVQAYAYFLYHSQRLKDDAKKRLRAIVEASELGSGFQIAMRDLEIRGAGEILGASQSGSMQTVGVSHYLRMLKAAVTELQRGGEPEEDTGGAIEILLPFEALLPSYYITDPEEKIAVYQKLAGSEDEVMLAEFAADLRAEYGPLPVQAENLLDVLRLKMACRRAGVQRVKAEANGAKRDVVLTLAPRVTAAEIMQLVAKVPAWRISGSSLRIAEEALAKEVSGATWLPEITRHVSFLIKAAAPTKRASRKEA